MIPTRFLVTGALVVMGVGCEDELPPNLGGNPIWYDLDFEDAVDLGHPPEERSGSYRAPGPITLTDVSEAAGLGQTVAGGNQHGVGVAFVDLTQDDWPDILIVNGRPESGGDAFPTTFWVNQGDGTFVDRTQASGLGVLQDTDGFSVAAADYDHDGDVDLYLGISPTDRLFQNQGDGTFVDVTEAAGAGGPASEVRLFRDGRSKVVSFGDFDGDGWLDIVSSSSTLPAPFAYLLRNRGDGTFEDISAASGVLAAPSGNPCAVLWTDYDNDRDQDLFIWNDRGGHVLLNNEDGMRFEDVTRASTLDEVRITHPMGIDGADIDRDGDLDYYISNIGNNPLLRNNGDGTFSDITDDANTEGDFGWGLSFEDFDNDGWQDIFVAQEDQRPHLVFRHRGTLPPEFERIEVPHIPVLSRSRSHNVAAGFADYDRDGRVDVLIATTDGTRVTLYRNDTDVGDARWLHVRVPRAPGQGNAGAVTARVVVRTGDIVQFEDVLGGSSRASQNAHTVRFGLGPYSGADWAAVLWPDGQHQVATQVEGDQQLVLDF